MWCLTLSLVAHLCCVGLQNNIKVKKRFVRYISHEIRTPLNAVSLGLRYLSDELPKYIQDQDILDTVATSQSACAVSVNTLTDLLTFDKIEDGELKLDRQEVSVKELVLAATSIFAAQVCYLHLNWIRAFTIVHISLLNKNDLVSVSLSDRTR